ncbi:MAG: acylphosphatase [Kiritimatiellia bacterium]
MNNCLHAEFTGRVQGVGFRATCASLARRAGLSGWVRNCPDGSVELEIRGERSKIEAFLTELRGTYAGSGIRDEQVTWKTAETKSGGFEIRGW